MRAEEEWGHSLAKGTVHVTYGTIRKHKRQTSTTHTHTHTHTEAHTHNKNCYVKTGPHSPTNTKLSSHKTQEETDVSHTCLSLSQGCYSLRWERHLHLKAVQT